jgi:hypothetical protein
MQVTDLKLTINKYQLNLIFECIDIAMLICIKINNENIENDIKLLLLNEFRDEVLSKITIKKAIDDKIKIKIKPSLSLSLLWMFSRLRTNEATQETQDSLTILKFIEILDNHKNNLNNGKKERELHFS